MHLNNFHRFFQNALNHKIPGRTLFFEMLPPLGEDRDTR